MLPNAPMDADRPVAEPNCYERGTVDALGRFPTDKPLCDDLDMFDVPAPPREQPRQVPDRSDRDPRER